MLQQLTGLRRAWLVALLLTLGVTLPASAAPQRATSVRWPTLTLTQVATGFNFPVHLTAAGDGSGRLFIVEKAGRIFIWQNGQRLSEPFLDIRSRVRSSCSECGLLSVAFPPDYAESGYFFVYYNATAKLFPTDPPDAPSQDSVIARFRVSDDPNRADPDSEEYILTQQQPASNHNGGQIAFAPDGTLFIGFGDGGGGGDPFRTGQNLNTWLGKLLRIQVGATGTYTVPADNPFVGTPGVRPEIWAYGLRNPWRFAFDRVTGALYIADVGQQAYEEVNHEPPGHPGGSNYGWVRMEGPRCYPALDLSCDMSGLTMPVAWYEQDGRDRSITGGEMFRSRAPNQAPIYLYGDYGSGRVRGLQFDADAQQWVNTLLLETNLPITSFGLDEEENVYFVTGTGQVWRVDELLDLPLQQWLPALRAD